MVNLLRVAALFVLCIPLQLFAMEEDYLSVLQRQAKQSKLAFQRQWQVLMHYTPRLFGNGVFSLVDTQTFFLAAEGKKNPEAELQATLKSFFWSEGEDEQATQCRFPARFAWLKQALHIDVARLPQRRCNKLDNYLNNLNVGGISLIFPVSYLNNPPSMFGHTFLRLDSHTEWYSTDLLAWTVNFAARTEESRGLVYAFKGLFGGYQGMFSLARYYSRVKEYGDLESRDIWEYQLAFNEQEVHRLMLHLWELLPVHFDYFFIDENCSFQLLSLLEAARPELRLTEHFRWDAIPADTVRVVNAQPGLLKNAVYRPSNRNMVTARANLLESTEQELAKALVDDDLRVDDPVFKAMPEQTYARILELAYEYNAYQNAGIIKRKREDETVDEITPYALLAARSKVPVDDQRPEVSQAVIRPDQGHGSRRFAIQYGYEDPLHFLQLDFRWAFHDLYDPQAGFVEGAQLEFIKPALRYYPEQNQLQLEAFDIASITAIAPRNRFIKPFSWQVSAAVQRERFAADDRPLMGAFDGGLGVSYRLPGNALFSALATASIRFSDRFNQYIAVGGGGEIQVLYDVSQRWRIGLAAEVTQYFQGITHLAYAVSLKQRYQINHANALVLDVGQSREFGDSFFVSTLTWQIYF